MAFGVPALAFDATMKLSETVCSGDTAIQRSDNAMNLADQRIKVDAIDEARDPINLSAKRLAGIRAHLRRASAGHAATDQAKTDDIRYLLDPPLVRMQAGRTTYGPASVFS